MSASISEVINQLLGITPNTEYETIKRTANHAVTYLREYLNHECPDVEYGASRETAATPDVPLPEGGSGVHEGSSSGDVATAAGSGTPDVPSSTERSKILTTDRDRYGTDGMTAVRQYYND